MESEVNYRRVGIFLILGLVFLSISLLWLSKYFSANASDQYVIYFGNHSLDGLQKDSVVSMKGIRVGSVRDYEIAADDIQRVKVLISLDRGIPVKVDTRAVLRRNLLTGLAKIDLVGGTQQSEILKGTDTLPEIKEDVTDLDRIADSIPALLEKLEGIASRVTLVLSDENIEHFRESMNSLDKFTKGLSDVGEPLGKTLANIENISHKLSKIVSELEKATVSKDGVSKGALESFTSSIQSMEEILAELKLITRELGPELRTFTRKVSGIGRDMEIISDSISKLADRYSDPAGLFRKKENSDEAH